MLIRASKMAWQVFFGVSILRSKILAPALPAGWNWGSWISSKIWLDLHFRHETLLFVKRSSFLIQRETRRQKIMSDYCQANFASTRTSSCGQPRRPLFVCLYDSPTGNHNMPNTCWFSERRFPLCSWDIWRSRETSACKDWCQASLLQEDFVWSYSLADELDENILLQVAKDHRITWIRKRVKAHLGGIQLRISPPRRTLLESSFALQEWNFATREKVFIWRQRENCTCKYLCHCPISSLPISECILMYFAVVCCKWALLAIHGWLQGKRTDSKKPGW